MLKEWAVRLVVEEEVSLECEQAPKYGQDPGRIGGERGPAIHIRARHCWNPPVADIIVNT